MLLTPTDWLSLLIVLFGRTDHAFAQQTFLELLLCACWTDRALNTGFGRLVHVMIWMSEARALPLLTEPWSPPALPTVMSGMCQREVICRACDSVPYICKISLSERKYLLLLTQILYWRTTLPQEEPSEGKWRPDKAIRPPNLHAFYTKNGRFWGCHKRKGLRLGQSTVGQQRGAREGVHGRSGSLQQVCLHSFIWHWLECAVLPVARRAFLKENCMTCFWVEKGRSASPSCMCSFLSVFSLKESMCQSGIFGGGMCWTPSSFRNSCISNNLKEQ